MLPDNFLESFGHFLGDPLVDSVLLLFGEVIELLSHHRIGDLVKVDAQIGQVLPNHSNN